MATSIFDDKEITPTKDMVSSAISESKPMWDKLQSYVDPLIKLYFNKSFQTALDEHCNIEWDKLADFLNPSKADH
jgi:hypothetical protein